MMNLYNDPDSVAEYLAGKRAAERQQAAMHNLAQQRSRKSVSFWNRIMGMKRTPASRATATYTPAAASNA